MANLGDIGLTQAAPPTGYFRSAFTLAKTPTNVIIHIDDALPYAGGVQRNPVIFFTQYGTRVDQTFVDGSGNAYAYDWDDGVYYAQQVGTGNTWQITVVGTVVTIIRLSSFGTPVVIYAA